MAAAPSHRDPDRGCAIPDAAQERLRRFVDTHFAPAAILADERFRLLAVMGPAHRYLTTCDRHAAHPDLLAIVAEPLRSSLRAQLMRSQRGGRPAHGRAREMVIDGKQTIVRISVQPVERGHFVVLFDEQSPELAVARGHLKRAARHLAGVQVQLHRQASALHSAANAILIVDQQGRIDWANEAFLRACGYSAGEVTGRSADFLAVDPGIPAFAAIVAEGGSTGAPWSGEVRNRDRTGRLYTVWQTVTPITSPSGDVAHFVVVQDDITQRKEAERRMLYMAEHDELTGLWNRHAFLTRLSGAIARNVPRGRIAVLFLDIDRFKNTNDSLGHIAGDRMLVEIARRLRLALDANATLARFGGDEFVLFFEQLADRPHTATVVERMLESFQKPIDVNGRPLLVTASIGVTMFPDDGDAPEELLRNADLAMYRAKAKGGRGYRFYDQRLEAEVQERAMVERELSRALDTGDLWIAYQPQWEVSSGVVSGAESLLRWKTARDRSIPVSRVVSIAEECGAILPIGQWILRESVMQQQVWQRKGYPLRVSINLSAIQLQQQNVTAIIIEAARGHLQPGAIKVEITESVLLHRSQTVRETLQSLHAAGVGIVLDDFGTGYSSLTYLQQFPIESVKIDASFLRGVGRSANDEAIVNGIIQLAHSLGLSVVAEGVETPEQQEFLRACGCDFAQGFLLSRAVTSAEFEQHIGADWCLALPEPAA